MSEFKVCFTKIKEIHPHPNPVVERLEIAVVYGFQVIVQKGKYQPGDFALFIPIDSVLNQDLESLILGPNPKIKFDRHRVKQIRIQKFPSQGLLVDVSTIDKYLETKGMFQGGIAFKLEEDYQALLDIKKYEPPLPEFQRNPREQTRKEKPLENPLFHKYNGLENVKWFPDLFKEGEEVVIQEKLHGSNCRAGLLKVVKPKPQHILNELKAFNLRGALVLLGKFIKMSFSKEDVYEIVYGSNNVELTNRGVNNRGYYGENVYLNVLEKVDAFNKLKPNEIIYGELIGEGIQKNYHYGHKEHHFVLFDVKLIEEEETRWLTPDEVEDYAKERGFDTVPRLFAGPFNKQIAYELTKGDSVYCPKQKVREGIVIKAVSYNDKSCACNKKALKWISEKYLDSDNSDFH